ncbi:hypothetical protein [Devosia sp.]|uniref:hypothetical protein n=1 Tax=Devosia sp. TaxID=1871048 RepID=UPI0032638B6A
MPPTHSILAHSAWVICWAMNFCPLAMALVDRELAVALISMPGRITMKATNSQNAERSKNIGATQTGEPFRLI